MTSVPRVGPSSEWMMRGQHQRSLFPRRSSSLVKFQLATQCSFDAPPKTTPTCPARFSVFSHCSLGSEFCFRPRIVRKANIFERTPILETTIHMHIGDRQQDSFLTYEHFIHFHLDRIRSYKKWTAYRASPGMVLPSARLCVGFCCAATIKPSLPYTRDETCRPDINEYISCLDVLLVSWSFCRCFPLEWMKTMNGQWPRQRNAWRSLAWRETKVNGTHSGGRSSERGSRLTRTKRWGSLTGLLSPCDTTWTSWRRQGGPCAARWGEKTAMKYGCTLAFDDHGISTANGSTSGVLTFDTVIDLLY